MKKFFEVDVEQSDDKDESDDAFYDLDPVEVELEISCTKTGKSRNATVTVPACFMPAFKFMTERIHEIGNNANAVQDVVIELINDIKSNSLAFHKLQEKYECVFGEENEMLDNLVEMFKFYKEQEKKHDALVERVNFLFQERE